MRFKYCAMIATMLGGVLSSCQSDTIEIPAKELYNRDFFKQFGVFDTSQSWNTAKRASAQVDPTLLRNAQRVEVYTALPGNKSARMLANYQAEDASEFTFDVPAGCTSVYFRIVDTEGNAISTGYKPIENGTVVYAGSRSGSRSDETPTNGVDKLAYDKNPFGSVRIIPQNIDSWRRITNKNGDIAYTDSKYKFTDGAYKSIWGWTREFGWDDIQYYDFGNQFKNLGKEIGPSGCAIGNYDKYVAIGPFDTANQNDKADSPDFKASETKGVRIRVSGVVNEQASDYSGAHSQIALCCSHLNGNDFTFIDTKDLESEKSGTEFNEVFDVTAAGYLRELDKGSIITGRNITVTNVEVQELPYNQIDFSDIFDVYQLARSTFEPEDIVSFADLCVKPTYGETSYSIGDILPLVGSNSTFGEGKCNYEAYKTAFNTDKGVEYVLNGSQEVSIDFFYGCGAFNNTLGYYYWEGDLTPEEIIKLPKFILIGDAYPCNAILFETTDKRWIPLSTGHYKHEFCAGPKYHDGLDCTHVNYASGAYDEGKVFPEFEWYQEGQLFKEFVQQAEQGNKQFSENVFGGNESRSSQTFTGQIKPAKYRLVHYDIVNGEPTNPSYEFKDGTHIGFFIITGGAYFLDWYHDNTGAIDYRRLSFSMPSLNTLTGNTLYDGHSHYADGQKVTNGGGEPKPWSSFVTYKYGDHVIMGVEDLPCETDVYLGKDDGYLHTGGDHDMNDILFKIDAKVIETEIGKIPDPETPKMSWIVACEDLGVFDYDFNDVVFGVTHASGEEYADIVALASGGTLPVHIWSKYPQINTDGNLITGNEQNGGYILKPEGTNGGEFHSWWGANRSSANIINAARYEGIGTSARIKVPFNYSVSTLGDSDSNIAAPADDASDMGGFRVLVTKNGNQTETITAPQLGTGEAPQMFLVPSTWHWPSENQHILGVYQSFTNWSDGTQWWLTKDGPNADSHIKHNWNNQ